ncbi:hypothetical protein LVD15_17265 [Fulvivirga maritima]|uniref:hypothetical protein n=1 Tax=Fulvivirga maritima TaxID=2904247 RepID=UPI001F23656F|nr:hypothetical protein [Fulvivirga maritima]UII25050.1 hypothetical protein LVD15_17265 [Fulvivirga maritima]
MKYYFKRHWDETRGDDYDSWGTSDWWFETDETGEVIRQMEFYEAGPVLKYNELYPEDKYGGLSEVPLDLKEFKDFAITEQDFENQWNTSLNFT